MTNYNLFCYVTIMIIGIIALFHGVTLNTGDLELHVDEDDEIYTFMEYEDEEVYIPDNEFLAKR